MNRRNFLSLTGLASIGVSLGILPRPASPFGTGKFAIVSEVAGSNTFVAEIPQGVQLLRKNMYIHVDGRPRFYDGF